MTKEISIYNVHQEIKSFENQEKGCESLSGFQKKNLKRNWNMLICGKHIMHIFAHTERANGSEKLFGLSGFTHSQTSFESLDFCDLSYLRHLH